MKGQGLGMGERQDPLGEIFVDERPWGAFQQFVTNEAVTVKTITVRPGHRLSLQRHSRRSELWHVIDGPIEVTVGERTWSVASGENVWVPVGTVHRMANAADGTGRVLEVAFGHFDEDDIVRLEDDYFR